MRFERILMNLFRVNALPNGKSVKSDSGSELQRSLFWQYMHIYLINTVLLLPRVYVLVDGWSGSGTMKRHEISFSMLGIYISVLYIISQELP